MNNEARWEPVEGQGSPSRPVWHLYRREPFSVLGYEYLTVGTERKRFSSLNAAKKAAAKLRERKL